MGIYPPKTNLVERLLWEANSNSENCIEKSSWKSKKMFYQQIL